MNVLLTGKCNRRCPYCFAAARISFPTGVRAADPAAPPEFISEADFQAVLDFVRRGREPVLGVLGGEPSLHLGFVDLLGRAWTAGLETKVFINGLWPEDRIDAFLAAA